MAAYLISGPTGRLATDDGHRQFGAPVCDKQTQRQKQKQKQQRRQRPPTATRRGQLIVSRRQSAISGPSSRWPQRPFEWRPGLEKARPARLGSPETGTHPAGAGHSSRPAPRWAQVGAPEPVRARGSGRGLRPGGSIGATGQAAAAAAGQLDFGR